MAVSRVLASSSTTSTGPRRSRPKYSVRNGVGFLLPATDGVVVLQLHGDGRPAVVDLAAQGAQQRPEVRVGCAVADEEPVPVRQGAPHRRREHGQLQRVLLRVGRGTFHVNAMWSRSVRTIDAGSSHRPWRWNTIGSVAVG